QPLPSNVPYDHGQHDAWAHITLRSDASLGTSGLAADEPGSAGQTLVKHDLVRKVSGEFHGTPIFIALGVETGHHAEPFLWFKVQVQGATTGRHKTRHVEPAYPPGYAFIYDTPEFAKI